MILSVRERNGISSPVFKEFFIHNLNTKSRTAKGVSETKVSLLKQPLSKTGDALKTQVAENTERVIDAVWEEHISAISASSVRELSEYWHTLISFNLTSPVLYRSWEVNYGAPYHPKPAQIGIWMEAFYAKLAKRIELVLSGNGDRTELLAWADRELDFVIHPWADGCGRHATVLIMWLSLVVPFAGQAPTLPRLSDHKTHYIHIKQLDSHIAYYRNCMRSI